MSTRIELHIERLVLDGLPLWAGDAARIQAAIEAELSRYLTEMPVQAEAFRSFQSSALEVVRAPAIDIGATMRPAQIGTRIAQSVSRGLAEEMS